ncbi:type II toxin-antitoxin system VapC family toxin [Candidatus Sumerlaeota bacterium]|nr:type II toxin-antitoxin system VapC family toxin [Candidatus Sumerlaeota bacterium]
MRLLVDTHALVWFLEDNPALSVKARSAIEAAEDGPPLVSHASAWETAIKVRLGKLRLPAPFENLFPGTIESLGFDFLPMRLEHFQGLIGLPMHHGDPFDRLLVAQAQIEKLALVTHDSRLSAYDVPLLW